MAAIGTRKLTLTIDAEDVTPEVSSAVIKAAELKSDFVSFAEAAVSGARQYSLALKFVQDAETGSLWDKVWSQAGTEIPVVVRPYGNATPTATQPHFTGTVTISEPNGNLLGGDANASASARFITDVEWIFVAKPTRVVA